MKGSSPDRFHYRLHEIPPFGLRDFRGLPFRLQRGGTDRCIFDRVRHFREVVIKRRFRARIDSVVNLPILDLQHLRLQHRGSRNASHYQRTWDGGDRFRNQAKELWTK